MKTHNQKVYAPKLVDDLQGYFTNIMGLYIYPRLAVQRQKSGKVIAKGLNDYQQIEDDLKDIVEIQLRSLK